MDSEVDTNEQFYFYAREVVPTDEVQEYVVVGLDFHSGLCAASPTPFGRKLYALDSRGTREVAGEAILIHRPLVGYQLVWHGQAFSESPCLLTTDPSYHKMSVLRVKVETSADELKPLLTRSHDLPIRGETWVGVLADLRGGRGKLTVFTSQEHLPEPLVGYNPDWSESIDEWVEGNFRFEVVD